MFGFGKKKGKEEQAIYELTETLKGLLGPWHDDMLLVLQHNAYIAGYVDGVIEGFEYCFENVRGINTNPKHLIRAMALNNVYKEDMEFIKRFVSALNSHIAKKTVEFREGTKKGSLFVAYLLGIRDVKDDPEFSEAVSRFRFRHQSEQIEDSGYFQQDMAPDLNNLTQLYVAALQGLQTLWFFDKIPKARV